jgi:RNA-directed DNA polymerase
MLSNLVARRLDESLYSFALEYGLVYTRYADDITFSATVLPEQQTIGKIHRKVVHLIRKAGFKENEKKIRVAGPGSKKTVLGLLVDGEEPRISKESYHRIDRHLHACIKYGLPNVAFYEGFDSAYGFYNHLSGLIAFVKDVDKKRWSAFSSRFKQISTPWSGGR